MHIRKHVHILSKYGFVFFNKINSNDICKRAIVIGEKNKLITEIITLNWFENKDSLALSSIIPLPGKEIVNSLFYGNYMTAHSDTDYSLIISEVLKKINNEFLIKIRRMDDRETNLLLLSSIDI